MLTFSTAEGAFVANIDGPIRAIRSYLGANSGPLTQRTHVFYDRVEVIQTFLRVHAIGGIMELLDYAADAPGMTYYNQHNLAGLAIDGTPDAGFDDTAFEWELVSGPHGSVISLLEPRLSQPLAMTAWYEDDANTPNDQCSASNLLDHPDDSAYGSSGMWIVESIPDTDPRNGSLDSVYIDRTSYYEAPDLTLVDAEALVARAQVPPSVQARSFTTTLGEPCGDAICMPGEADTCPADCNPFDQTCGDSLCDPWENSVNCTSDCSSGMGGGTECGDAVCDAGEHELNCADDCWTDPYEPLASCLSESCGAQTGACSDELPCVDLVVCTAECVLEGGAPATCLANCNAMIPTTPEQSAFANALLTCAQNNCA